MKLIIDTVENTLIQEIGEEQNSFALYSPEAFELISLQWIRMGWQEKYSYTFSWFGRPIIQLPEDLIRIQEVIYEIKPDVIIETGVAQGGSLVYYASLCKVLEKGRVIGIDIEIRPHNRQAIQDHSLSSLITLIEGNSVAPEVINKVSSLLKPEDVVLVILDSNHTKAHVLAELNAYHTFVTPRSYIVATDGIMESLHDVPHGKPEWAEDNPAAAAAEFVSTHPEFELKQPTWPFNESRLRENVTYWPGAWLQRRNKAH